MGPSDFGLESGIRLVGCLGNLKPQKDPITFVRVAERIMRQHPGVGFVFAGEGPLRSRVEREVQRRGLQSRFCLPGWIPNPAAFLRGLTVYLSTSLFEGLPRSVVQALRCGIPVVATRVGGIPEVVRTGTNGALAGPRKAPSLARHVCRILDDSRTRRRLSRGAAGSVGPEFRVQNMVRSLNGIYRELWKGRRQKNF